MRSGDSMRIPGSTVRLLQAIASTMLADVGVWVPPEQIEHLNLRSEMGSPFGEPYVTVTWKALPSPVAPIPLSVPKRLHLKMQGWSTCSTLTRKRKKVAGGPHPRRKSNR